MDPLTDILKPLLVLVLNEVKAPVSLIKLVEDTEPLPDAVDQLKDALPKMLDRGFPIFYDFEVLAAVFGIDLVDGVLKPLIKEALKKVGAPKTLGDLVDRADVSKEKQDELGVVMPVMLKRGYPMLAELEVIADIFGIDIVRDLLQPLVVAVLAQAGAPQAVIDMVKKVQVTAADLDRVSTVMPGVVRRRYPTYSDLEVVAAAFGIADPIEQLLKPLLIAALGEVGAPQEMIAMVEWAQIQVDKVAELKRIFPAMMERKYPLYSDLEVMAAALGKNLETDIIKPLILVGLSTAGAPDSVLIVVELAYVNRAHIGELKVALPQMLERRYPNSNDMKVIARYLDLDPMRDLITPIALASSTGGSSGSEEKLQELVSRGQALFSGVDAGASAASSQVMDSLAGIFETAGNDLGDSAEESDAEEEEAMTTEVLGSFKYVGFAAVQKAGSFFETKLDSKLGAVSSILGMALGNGRDICPPNVHANVDRFIEDLDKIRNHRTVQQLEALPEMLYMIGEIGFAILDAIDIVEAMTFVVRGLAAILTLIPPASVVGKVLDRVAKVVQKILDKFVKKAADKVDRFFLTPAVELADRITHVLTSTRNALDAIALTMSNLVRPPAPLFEAVATELRVCVMLEKTIPLSDVTGELLKFLNHMPVFDEMPSDPFESVPPIVFHMWDTAWKIADTVRSPFQGIADMLFKEHEVCVIVKCYKFALKDVFTALETIMLLFQGPMGLFKIALQAVADKFGSMLEDKIAGVIGGIPSFLPPGVAAIADLALTPAKVPNMLGIMKYFEAVNPVTELEKHTDSQLKGCTYEDTGIMDVADSAVEDCFDGGTVFWEAQCSQRCDECSSCFRWYMVPEDSSSYRCYLRPEAAGYMELKGAHVGLHKACVQTTQEQLWKREGFERHCRGEEMFQTGVRDALLCEELCKHDQRCQVFQFHAGRSSCIVGQSFDCTGESGWSGARKQPSARQEMKQMCSNLDRAEQLQNEGAGELDPTLQSVVDVSQSTCMQYACGLAGSDLDCGDQNKAHMTQMLRKHCDTIPEWTLGEWGSCQSDDMKCGSSGRRTREVTCSVSDAKRCEVARGPAADSEACTVTSTCLWEVGPWGTCDAVDCQNPGEMTRQVTCNSIGGSRKLCDGKGLPRPEARSVCWMIGCEDPISTSTSTPISGTVSDPISSAISTAPTCQAVRLRRLHASYGPPNDEEQRPLQIFKPTGIFAPSRSLQATEAEVVAMTPAECMEMYAASAACVQIGATEGVAMNQGGAAGITMQMSFCQADLADKTYEQAKANGEAIAKLKDQMEQQAAETKAQIENATAHLSGVVAEVGKDVIDAMKAESEELAETIRKDMEAKAAAQSKYLSCKANLNHEAVMGQLRGMESRLSEEISNLSADMQQGFADMTNQLNGMENRIQDSLLAVADSVVSDISASIKAAEERQAQEFRNVLSVAMTNIQGNMTDEIRASEGRTAALVKSELAAQMQAMADAQDGQTDELLDALGDQGAAIMSKLEEASGTMQDMLFAQSQDDLASTSMMLDKLSRSLSQQIVNEAAAANEKAAERSERLERVLGAAVATAAEESKEQMKALQEQVAKGNAKVVAAVTQALGSLQQDIRKSVAEPLDKISQKMGEMSTSIESGFAKVGEDMNTISEKVEAAQQTMQTLLQRSDQSLVRMQGIEDGISALQDEVVRLNEKVLEGQERLADQNAALNTKLDNMIGLVGDARRESKDYHITEIVARFKEASILIDGAFLDFRFQIMPNASASSRRLQVAMSGFSSCRDDLSSFATAMASEEETKGAALTGLRRIWATIRDQFVILSGILVESRLLNVNFDSVALTVTLNDMRASQGELAQLAAREELPAPVTCSAWFGPSGAKSIRSLLLQKLKEQPLALAQRASTVWQQVLRLAEQQESMGQRVGIADMDHVRHSYSGVLRNMMRLRNKLVGPDGGIMHDFHTQVLDQYLTQLCPVPKPCSIAIFKKYMDPSTDELVVWRSMNDSLVVVRKPSYLLRLQGTFAWDIDLTDETTFPEQLPSEFEQAVYLCTSDGMGGFSAHRASDASTSDRDAFRFCSLPAAGLNSTQAPRCGPPGASYGQSPVDSWTPGSGLQEDIFKPWENEARDYGLFSSVCGNGIFEFGEVCDEGAAATGGCLDCRSVAAGWTCPGSGACRPRCGDGLVFRGVEECDDGGLLLGCTSSCRIAECRRLEAAALADKDNDKEMTTLWTRLHQMPNPPDPDLLHMQGYTLCFNFTDDGSSPVTSKDLEACNGASRLSFVVASPTLGIASRHDFDFADGTFHFQAGIYALSGPHQLRVRTHDNSERELVLSCRQGSAWDACVLWAVREGRPASGSPRSQDGLSALEADAETFSFLVYAPPSSIVWNCSDEQRVVPTCGDGMLAGPEQCDDGNRQNFDGCSANCTLEPGWLCPSPGALCQSATCGDGKTGAWPSLCDMKGDAGGCWECDVWTGWLCRTECNTTDEDTSDVQGLSSYEEWLTATLPKTCCMQGPTPADRSCELGAACSFATDLSWLPESQFSEVLISPAEDGPCGDAARAAEWKGGSAFANPIGKSGSTSAFSTYSFGVPLSGLPGGIYRMCWGPAPKAAWSSGSAQLHGFGEGRTAKANPVAYPFDIGKMTLRGPVQNHELSCTLGLECILQMTGHGLDDGTSSSLLISSSNSCQQGMHSLASLRAGKIRVESHGAHAGQFATFSLNGQSLTSRALREGIAAIVFRQYIDVTTAQLYKVDHAMTPFQLATEILATPEGSLVLVAVAGETERTLSDKKLLGALRYLGARKAEAFIDGGSYALVGIAGSHSLAEDMATPSSGQGVDLSAVLGTARAPEDIPAANSSASFGVVEQGSGRNYSMCWDRRAYNASLEIDSDMYIVKAGVLSIHGPGPGHQHWTCTAGNPCTLDVSGIGLLPESFLKIGERGFVHCTDPNATAIDSDFQVPGLATSASAQKATSNVGGAMYKFGTVSARFLGQFSVCWKAAASDAEWMLVGDLEITESACTADFADATVSHNCVNVGFLETCQLTCAAGYAGGATSMTCKAGGELDGRVPTCRLVSCDSVSLSAVLVAPGNCSCGEQAVGSITWQSNRQVYAGSCRECTAESLACGIGDFRKGCGGSNEGVCTPCENLVLGEYFASNGGISPNGCRARPCRSCPVGEYPAGCGPPLNFGGGAGICETCTNMPNVSQPTHYFSSSGGADGICTLSPCLPDCGVGQYKRDCGGTSAGYCSVCSPPNDGYRHSDSGGMADQCPEKACDECDAGFYRTGCEMASKGQCVPCSNGPGTGYYYTGHGSTTNTCPYTTCPSCPAGKYRAECQGPSIGACYNCSKDPDTYFVGSGGLSDACPVKICARGDEECAVGEYRLGCGSIANPISPGVCTPCKPHQAQHFYTSSGGTVSSGCQESPCQRCDTGFFRNNCKGASAGECLACAHQARFYFISDGGFRNIVNTAAPTYEPPAACTELQCRLSEANCTYGFKLGSCGEDEHHVNPGVCIQCPDGHHQDELNLNYCKVCPPGTFALAGARFCTECPDGQYATRSGMSACVDCAGGSVTRRRSTTCTACSVGQYNLPSGDDCRICQGGFVRRRVYQAAGNGADATLCTPCDLTMFDGDDTSDDCVHCIGGAVRRRLAPNREEVYGARSCVGCPAGLFQDGSSEDCSVCEQGSVRRRDASGGVPSGGAMSCDHCAPGYWDDNSINRDDCITCPGGYVNRRRSTECRSCPLGKYKTDASSTDDCVWCNNGEVRRRVSESLMEARTCVSCVSGKYDPLNSEMDECQVCRGGSVRRRTASDGAKECTPCPFTTFNDGTHDECWNCKGGSVENSRSSCVACPDGRWQDGSNDACQTCEGSDVRRRSSATSPALLANDADEPATPPIYLASTAITCVDCANGWYKANIDVDSCSNCARGTEAGHTQRRRATFCNACAAGTWAQDNSDGEANGRCYTCAAGYEVNRRRATQCTQCPVGKYRSQLSTDACVSCAGGYCDSGRSFTECPAGEYNPGDSWGCTNCIGDVTNRRRAGLRIQCTGCSSGKYYDSSKGDDGCVQYAGSCSNGNLISETQRLQHNHCGICNSNYVLSNRQCHATCALYSCPSGTKQINSGSIGSSQSTCCETCGFTAVQGGGSEGCNSGSISVDTPYGRQGVPDGGYVEKSGQPSWYCDGSREGNIGCSAGNCVMRSGSGRRRFSFTCGSCNCLR
eukprot:TRINITY_DN8717_c0_g1_i1.p1 TRINITY_DN8717_c0_g1~~TRINITY_DN8717_c0_g1_i1.p1  ORF type:complete len:4275 (-),score=745.93 TRINITY_DN8717_c0_g1_i1:795-13364(-)